MGSSFKPYYKWNTFNTVNASFEEAGDKVLNLIINGIPSIHITDIHVGYNVFSFKPYYKWNTFNTRI